MRYFVRFTSKAKVGLPHSVITLHASVHIAESGDIKASVAVLSFILSSAAKHNVESESLSSELQQLGLPKGESDKIIYVFAGLRK